MTRLSDADERYRLASRERSRVPPLIIDPVAISQAADLLRPAATPREEATK